MTYRASLEFLDSLDRFGIRPGLERIARLCHLAGHPERAYPSVLVAGTNGKGSTCAFLAAILTAARLRVGTSPKPHLYTPRERLQVDGRLCPEPEFAALVAEARPWIDTVRADPRLGPVTYFEAMTLMALLWFARRRVDWAVVEVGLGGRLDATNVLDAALSVVTNVGVDHVDRLGNTVEEIAAEKAGILRRGKPAVTAAAGDALTVIERHAAALSAPLWRLGGEVTLTGVRCDAEGSRFDLETPLRSFRDLEIRMRGWHQAENAALAAAAALRLAGPRLPPSESAVRKGLAEATLPGRLEQLAESPLILIDAAHNPDGARRLLEALRTLFLDPHPGRKLILVVGLSEVHQPEEMARILAPAADRFLATASRHVQATPAARVAELARASVRAGVIVEESATVAEAVAAARAAARADDLVCVTGSIFTIAEVPRG